MSRAATQLEGTLIDQQIFHWFIREQNQGFNVLIFV